MHRDTIEIRHHKTKKIAHARVKANLKKLIFKVESTHEITRRNEFFNNGQVFLSFTNYLLDFIFYKIQYNTIQ